MTFFDHLTPSKGAVFSRDRVYRYLLWRGWNKKLPTLVTIGLNPSTADEFHNDPTIARLINLAKRLRFGRLVMLNAFAYRSTKRSKLKQVADPIGPDNDKHILDECEHADKIIVCWGNDGSILDRASDVLALLEGYQLWCLGVTRQGHPLHPLYLLNSVIPIKYQGDFS